MRSGMIIGLTATVLIVLGIAANDPIEDQVRCRLLSASHHSSSIYVFVPKEEIGDLKASVERFAQRNGLIFGMARYPSGIDDSGHVLTDLAVCNREIEVQMRNTYNEEVFSVRVRRHSQASSTDFEVLDRAFASQIIERFEVVENSDPEGIGN